MPLSSSSATRGLPISPPISRGPIQVEIVTESLLGRESLNDYRSTFESHPFTRLWVTRETTDPLSKLRIISWRKQKTRSTILDKFRDSADRAPNHRELTRQAFEDHQ